MHYSLTVVAAGEGTIGVEPSLPTYPPGTEDADSQAGRARHDNWEGDASGTEELVTIVMDGHKTVSIRYPSDNQPPTVAIVSPRAGQFFSAPGDVETVSMHPIRMAPSRTIYDAKRRARTNGWRLAKRTQRMVCPHGKRRRGCLRDSRHGDGQRLAKAVSSRSKSR